MRYFLPIVFLVLAACGKVTQTDHLFQQPAQPFKPTGIVDGEMQAFLNEYNAEARDRGVVPAYSKIVEVNWVDDLKMGDQTLWGLCQTYTNPDLHMVSSITLSRHLNTDVPACARKLIIFHEFSHGLLGVKHTDHDPSNILQIMYWSSGYEQSANCDKETGETYGDWANYLDFLFLHQDLEKVD